jgi:MOSC domain-containing protein YiiM
VSARARIVQISVSGGGVPKLPVPAARVTVEGVEGDSHRNHEHHGGPERAVCLYSMEAIHGLIAEGHSVAPGTLGENVTIEGLDWTRLTPGTELLLGEVVRIRVTRYTSPCLNIRTAFSGGDFSRVSQKKHPGWSRVYARVLRGGTIRTGEAVRID